MNFHHNSQKRYYRDNTAYFITTRTCQSIDYFQEPILCDLFIDNLKMCKKIKRFNLYAFCILYDHMHLLLMPGDRYNISKIMHFLKRHFTRDANYLINNEGAIRESRLRGGKYECYNDIIKNHDVKLKRIKNNFITKYGKNQIIIPEFKWQKSFHDHIIRNHQDLQNHYQYTAYNFQKHGLPENWKFTSLNYPALVDTIPF